MPLAGSRSLTLAATRAGELQSEYKEIKKFNGALEEVATI
jgi:hypothetical protein